MLMYTVHDKAAKAYLPPFTAPSERDAVSSFQEAANDPKSNINRYPADFTLLQIAEWDEREGVLTKLSEPKILGNATAFKQEQ